MRYTERGQQTGRSPADGVRCAVAGGWFNPGEMPPGLGLGAPERGRDQTAGDFRTRRASKPVFRFAGAVCLPRPARRCARDAACPQSCGACACR